MENNIFKNGDNESFLVSFGIDRSMDPEIQEFIKSFDFLSNIEFTKLGFSAVLNYDNIRIITGKLTEKGINIYSIMRKGC